jgi:mannose-6-phosphate isomerase-like protein (cupin superfamily)
MLVPQTTKIKRRIYLPSTSQISGTSNRRLVISSAKMHKTVDEIWYFVSGNGQLWRKRDGEKEKVIDIECELSVTIPVGTHFQFKNTGNTDLVILIVTSPIWPREEEAESIPNHW